MADAKKTRAQLLVEVQQLRQRDLQQLAQRNLELEREVAERQRAEALARQQGEQLRVLHEASQRLTRTLDLQEVYQAACDAMALIAPNDSMVISAFEPATKLIHCRAFWMKQGGWLDVGPFPAIPLEEEGRGTQSIAIRTGKSLRLGDYQAWMKTAQTSYYVDDQTSQLSQEAPAEAEEIMQSALIVPLQRGGEVCGVVQVLSCRRDAYTEDQLSLLEALSLHIAAAEQNALLYAQVQGELNERRLAEAALGAGEEQKRAILHTAMDGFWMADATGRLLEVNETYCRMSGYSEAELLGLRVADLEAVETAAETAARIQQIMAAGEGRFESKHRRRDGRVFEVEVSVQYRPVDGGCLVVFVRDITERKRLEGEMIRTQRLRAAGELSAGLCHNLNNLLTGVLMPAEMLQLASDDPRINRLAGTIVEVGTRAADLVQRLHRSVRGVSAEPLTGVDLNETIEAVVQMGRPRWKDEPEARGLAVEVRLALAPVRPIRATRSEVYDLLVNLLFNAVDALPEGGVVTITTAGEGPFVRLDFGDTGVGMDEATRLRVFEPFFTTKANLGTGLGLSTLYRSVSHWGGMVAVASSPGAGTTFTLHLPVWAEAMAPAAGLAGGTAARPGRVLVVDDDQTIGAVLCEALGGVHQVAVCADGQQALARFRPGCFEVAILDLGLPGTTGVELARQLQERDPTVARVLFSGWVLEADDPRRGVFDLVLQKPLRDLRRLDQAVAQAIELCRRRRGE